MWSADTWIISLITSNVKVVNRTACYEYNRSMRWHKWRHIPKSIRKVKAWTEMLTTLSTGMLSQIDSDKRRWISWIHWSWTIIIVCEIWKWLIENLRRWLPNFERQVNALRIGCWGLVKILSESWKRNEKRKGWVLIVWPLAQDARRNLHDLWPKCQVPLRARTQAFNSTFLSCSRWVRGTNFWTCIHGCSVRNHITTWCRQWTNFQIEISDQAKLQRSDSHHEFMNCLRSSSTHQSSFTIKFLWLIKVITPAQNRTFTSIRAWSIKYKKLLLRKSRWRTRMS